MVRSQLLGGMIWGLGQFLMEESCMDRRTVLWMNGNLGEALVQVSADVANFEVILLEEDDTRAHPLGAKAWERLVSWALHPPFQTPSTMRQAGVFASCRCDSTTSSEQVALQTFRFPDLANDLLIPFISVCLVKGL